MMKAGAVMSRLVFVGVVTMTVLSAFVLLHGVDDLTLLVKPVGSGVSFYATSILLLSGLYAFVVYPRFKVNAVWVLGLMWGVMEGIGVAESSIGLIQGSNSPGNPVWMAYMASLLVFSSTSVAVLRHAFRFNPASSILFAFALVWVPITWKSPGLLPFNLLDAVYDSLVASAVILMVKVKP